MYKTKAKDLESIFNSISELETEGLQVSYFFIDDNDQLDSKIMLDEFCRKNFNTIVYQANDKKDVYICDANTHHWKEQLIWRVAAFKNKIINYAKQKAFDYLFFN